MADSNSTLRTNRKQRRREFHGMTESPEYNIWNAMISRCTNPNVRDYHSYGGRGITVCDEWMRSFKAFYESMGPRPEGHELDRIDTNGNYEPTNCRWVTIDVQSRNQRRARMVTFNGVTKNLVDWSKETGVSPSLFIQRCKLGWSEERAISIPPRNFKCRRSRE